MDIQKELFYREFVQRENNVLRAAYDPELEFYAYIKMGDVKKVRELCKQTLAEKEGLGVLSENPLQNMKYHFVITTAMVARFCIEGGMEVSVAYSLSDFYIQKADWARTIREIEELHPVMALDYTKRMKDLGKYKICAKPIAECVDYIYENLHTRITVEELADFVKLTPSYLSRLFKKETGCTVSDYIQEQKVHTAQNMLSYSEYSLSEIASILAFSSQSYFTEVFRKRTGMTPAKYRVLHFRSVGMMGEDTKKRLEPR